jgi:hypothetical protein
MNTTPRTASEQKLLTNHPALLIGGPKKQGKNRRAPDVLSIPELQHRAETMTPLLKAILDYRPRPHWR